VAAAEADKKVAGSVPSKARKKGRSVASLIKERGGHDLKAQRSCKERKVTPGLTFFSPSTRIKWPVL
jgi:hypothetical protein